MTEGTPQAFIVRVWLEEAATDTSSAMWRGHVTHVPTEARVAFNTLDDLGHIIRRLLTRLDAPLPPGSRGVA